MIERIPGAVAPPPKPVCQIQVVLFDNGSVVAQVNPTPPTHVIRGMLAEAEAELVAAVKKKQRAGPGIEVAPPGFPVERNGG